MKGTVALSWGRFGGFYLHRNRICVGRLALTRVPVEIDDLMRAYGAEPRLRRRLAKANLWNRRHQLKCGRLRQQIAGDQAYIDALEAVLDVTTITEIRKRMVDAREALSS